ncbi:MAG: BTAD domain-containing putative transcriptional regulator, partial [Actinobacteria bacterium]|nr:BTAD domain-containing putative transcriptional regulator [Actinomycetota bacterium]
MEVRTDRLVDDLWGDDSAERNTVQSKVSMLRRALGDSLVITGSRMGYSLEVEPSSVDAIEVLNQQETAQSMLASGDAAGALEVASGALAMFHGDVLPEAGDGSWVEPHRTRLEESRLALLETKFGAAVDVNPPGSTIAELEDLVRQHPLRERLWELLMLALYRAQRQADALEAYRRIAAILDEELGLTPGPRLRALEQMVLEQDAALDGTWRATPVPGTIPRGNLPSLTSDLIGRDDDLVALSAELSRRRLVTIVGPAGVGKTRLAIEIGRGTDREGAWLVRLEAAGTGSQISAVMGDALGLNGATESMIIDRLRTTTGLVILDNCEHVVDAVAELATTILDQLPGIRLLATSQVPIAVDGEVVYSLRPLPLAESVALFTRKSLERRPSFNLDPDTAVAVEGVCRALDGLPLAIELAAARTKALSVQEIARRLDDRFGLLSDPAGRGPARHRALSAAITWSFDLLFPDEKQVLSAIACFADGGPLAAVECVASALGVPEAAAVDALGRLADRSLVMVDVGDGGTVRYRLLESVRLFALERLTEADLLSVARAAHATWFAEQADTARADQRGPRQGLHLAFVRIERANIDLALQWARSSDPLLGVRITMGFGWMWVILGEAQVAADRMRAAVNASDGAIRLEDRAVVLSQIAWNETGADLAHAEVTARAAVETASASSTASAIAESHFSLAFVMVQSGRAVEAIELMESWRRDARADATPSQVGISYMLLGYGGLASG